MQTHGKPAHHTQAQHTHQQSAQYAQHHSKPRTGQHSTPQLHTGNATRQLSTPYLSAVRSNITQHSTPQHRSAHYTLVPLVPSLRVCLSVCRRRAHRLPQVNTSSPPLPCPARHCPLALPHQQASSGWSRSADPRGAEC